MTDRLSFQQLGVSHHRADVAARERLADTVVALAAVVREAGLPHLLLATCNRVELYWQGPLPLDRDDAALAAPQLVQHRGRAAIQHLIAVAAGRDSQILGEAEILGQVRRAWQQAQAAGHTSPRFDQRVRRALAVARRVRREFPLASHARSVADVAIQLAQQHLPTRPVRVLVLGAGEAAVGAVRALHTWQPPVSIALAARRRDRADRAAAATGATVVPWADLSAAIPSVDLIVAATAARSTILTADLLAGHAGPVVLVDLGAPRNIDPTLRQRTGVTLLDLDDLRDVGCPAPAAHADDLLMQIDARIAAAATRIMDRRLPPMLAALHHDAERLATAEAEALSASLGVTEEHARDLIRDSMQRLVRRALFPASRALRRAPVDPVAPAGLPD